MKKIMVIGSGPVMIGQTGEYDYAAYLTCKTLRDEGYQVALVESNPASIATEPGVADHIYIEPLTVDSLVRVIEKEKPDAILPTAGGQTALNLVTRLDREGVLGKFGISVIGTGIETINKSEESSLFTGTVRAAGLNSPRSEVVGSIENGMQAAREIGFPVVLRPSYTAGGAGNATAYNTEEFVGMLSLALKSSPVGQVLIQESVAGWKEIEVQVMRDSADDTLTVAVTENIDPMGVHSGDSLAVLPPQTLTTDQLYALDDAARRVTEAVGVVGTASVRLALSPTGGAVAVIGINPRMGRGASLAARATGFPVAEVAAKLAVGYTLDELGYKELFEPMNAGSYCVVKAPRFDMERFPGAVDALDVSMKAVGDVVAIGRDFKQALQKAMRSLEDGSAGLGVDGLDPKDLTPEKIRDRIATPNQFRPFYLRYGVELGMSAQEISELSGIDPWFIEQIRELVEFEKQLRDRSLVSVPGDTLRQAKELGYSDVQLAFLLETDEEQVRLRRSVLGLDATYKQLDNAAFYSTYEVELEHPAVSGDKKVLIIGSGPNRIGQGAEFDYTTVQAAEAARELGYQVIVVNCNPDTLSTDPSVSDRLYLEPLGLEDVLGVVKREQPAGVVIAMGGQSPLKLTAALDKAKIPILGTSALSIERAEDRKMFGDLVGKLDLKRPEHTKVTSEDEAAKAAGEIGYPVQVRPSRIKGGKAMEIAYDEAELLAYLRTAAEMTREQPVLIDRFLEDATKVDVDAISDGETTVICGVMEHIEQAGIHSGDSAASLPPCSITDAIVEEIKRQVRLIACELEVKGLLNVQFAVKGDSVYILEVNPRASRSIPFVSQATGVAWAKAAAKVMLGQFLKEQGLTAEVEPELVSVKEAVFPFVRFPGANVILGPEMKSTGAVMGIGPNFGSAYIKAQIGAGQKLPEKGTAFVSVADRDKPYIAEIGKKLRELGFNIIATPGTAQALHEEGVPVRIVPKIGEGRPDITDLIKNGEVDFIVNTLSGKKPRQAEIGIRGAMLARDIPIVTTIAGARATVFGMEQVRS